MSLSVNQDSMKPVVTVAMNCFNCSKYLHEALESVFKQTFMNWEIVFLDNASTDNSYDIVRSCSYFDNIVYVKLDEKISLAEARNIVFGYSRGKYIAILDCDDIWLPQKLEKNLELFLANDNLGLVFSDAY